MIGVTHARIGAMLTRKWSFADEIVAPIEFHHQPLLSPDEHKEMVFVVYLGNAICAMEEGRINYSMLDTGVLEALDIFSEKQFNELKDRLERRYLEQQERFKDKK